MIEVEGEAKEELRSLLIYFCYNFTNYYHLYCNTISRALEYRTGTVDSNSIYFDGDKDVSRLLYAIYT